jgi:hypothetical protein
VIGTGNLTQQYQTGQQNNSALNVSGIANFVMFNQNGSSNAITGSGDVHPNAAGITVGGNLNRVGVDQNGNNNTLTASVVGAKNDVSYAQYGDNMVGRIDFKGVGQTMSVTQYPSFVPSAK